MKVGELFIVIDTKLDRFNKGMSDAQRSMVKIGKNFTAIGKKMTMMVTLPILALGAASVKAFANFDKAMIESLAIMGDVSDSMKKKMEDVAKTISEETIFSAKELAGAYYFLASAGMNAEQSVAALGDVARFAQAGAFDLATATDLLTDAQTALGLSSKNAAENQENLLRISDVLVKANTLANASVQQFSEALTNRAAAAMRMLGMEVEEGVAVLAAFADQGRKGSEAGEAFAIVIRDLQRAAIKNKEAFKEAGITVFDSSGEFMNMADIIGDLEDHLEGMSDEQKKTTLSVLGFQERSQSNIITLTGMSDKIRLYEKDMRKAGGTTKEVSEKQLKAFSNQMKLVRNELVNVGTQIGKILVPIIKELVENYIEPAIKWFSNLSEETKKTIVKFAGLAAILGPLSMIFGNIMIMIPAIATAFAALTSPIALVVASLIATSIHTKNLIKNFQNLSKTIGEYSEKSGEKISWLEKTWFGLNATIDKFTHGIGISEIAAKKMREEITKLDAKQLEYGKKVWDSIKGTEGFSKASEIFNKLLGIQKETIKKDSEAIEDHGKSTKEAAEETKTWIDYIKGVGLQTIKEKKDRIKELEGYIDGLSKAYAAGKLTLEDYTTSVKTASDEIKALSTSITTTAIPAFRDMSGVVDQAADKMESVFYDVSEAIKESTKDAEKAVEKTWEELHPFMSNLCADLAYGWSNLAVDVLGITEKITYQMKEFDNSYWENAKANMDTNYEERKQWIEDNITDEAEKNDMLKALELKHQHDVEQIMADEEAAKIKFEEDELKRQESLWNKIKIVFGNAVEAMLADWGTKFIGGILKSMITELIPGMAANCVKVKAAAALCGKNAGIAAGKSLTSSFASALGVVAIEAAVFAAFIGAVSLLDKLFPKHVKTMAELAAIEAKKAFDKAAKEYALPGEWGKGGIIAEPETGGGGQVPAEPEGNYQTGGLVPKTGLAVVHKGEYIIPKISVPSIGFPESMNVQPELRVPSNQGNPVMYNTVQIYAQKLDDYTIHEAGEKLFSEIDRQAKRRGY